MNILVEINEEKKVEAQYGEKIPQTIELTCNISKSGKPCLFESGGMLKNKGFAQIISTARANKKTPIYIRHHGDLACMDHALFVIYEGDIIIQAAMYNDENVVGAYKIVSIDLENKLVKAELLPFEDYLKYTCYVAVKKANNHHCRTAFFMKENPSLRYIKDNMKSPYRKVEENNGEQSDKQTVVKED